MAPAQASQPESAPAPEPESESAPVTEPEQTTNDVEWRFAWDDAPTYEMWVLTPGLQKGDKLGIVKDLGLVGRIGASLFVDYGFVSGDGIGNSWDIELRRLRIETTGRFSYGLDTLYKFSFGGEDGRLYLNDFWFAWQPSEWVQRVRFGYLDPPFSLQALTSSTERSFMEAAAPVAAFAPGYRLGLEARDRYVDPFDVSWIASLSSVGQSQQFSDASDSPFRASLRTAWRPGGVSDDPNVPLTHVAMSLGYSFSGTGVVHYRARPESSLAPYLVDTGDISGDAFQVGLEFARRQGPVTLQAEWMGSFVSSTDFGSLFFSGGYAELAWALTGEVRPYDARSALFIPSAPKNPFSWERQSIGGLEVAARIAYLDLTDRGLRGGRMLTLNASSIWAFNRFFRLHFDSIYADVKDRPSHENDFIVQMRIELTL
jgi:phosphate-selective porin OprO/OprP